mgnify:CR=1 FL=1
MDIQYLAVNRSVAPNPFDLAHAPHRVHKTFEQGCSTFLGQRFPKQVSSCDVFVQLTLIQKLNEKLDSLSLPDKLEYLHSVHLLLLVVSIEIDLPHVVIQKFLFIAVLRKIDILEFDQPELGEPG